MTTQEHRYLCQNRSKSRDPERFRESQAQAEEAVKVAKGVEGVTLSATNCTFATLKKAL